MNEKLTVIKYPTPSRSIGRLFGVVLLLLAVITPGFAETKAGNLSDVLTVQADVITGVVTDSEGIPIPGVNVVVKGTTNGTVTNNQGQYTIKVNDSSDILIFSFIGYQPKEVAANSNELLKVVLQESSTELGEVVKTALNISREKKSLGYSVQQVDGKEITLSKPTELSTALRGKVSGVQVFGAASSTFGDSKIRVRGVNDLNGSGPLYVIDGTPVSSSDIDMSIVESISVLKGPSAAALYGQRAAQGVILVTTKTGNRKGGMHIEVNSGYKIETIATFPELQNQYGQGNSPDDGTAYQFPVFQYNAGLHPADWATWNGQQMVDYASEMSWGPKMDGQMVRQWYSWYPDDANYGKLTPFSPHPNNIKDFFNTGQTFQNDISVSGGAENYDVRLNYNNERRSLVFPGSERNRNFFNFAGNFDVSKRIRFSTSLNIISDQIDGRPAEGDNGNNNATLLVRGIPRSVDIAKLENYQAGQFRYRNWNLGNPNALSAADFLYNQQRSANPYLAAYENKRVDNLLRIYGFAKLSYKITESLKAQATYNTDYNSGYWDYRTVTGSYPNNSDGTSTDYYSKENYGGIENNYEFLLSYNKKFNRISVNSNVGTNLRQYHNQSTGASTVSGLKIPGVYTIDQSFKQPNAYDRFSELETRSIYGNISLGFNDLVYVDASLRNDWSSTLPIQNNSYLYPAVSTSFVFSELLDGNVNQDIISFGKLRFGVAQVGSDMGAYNVYTKMPLTTNYGNFPGQAISSLLLNPDIKPTLSSSWDAGIEMKFFNNRVGFDFSVYNNRNKDQILEMPVPNVSGYNSMMVNAGLIVSKGYDLTFNATPFKRGNFKWDATFNISHNRSIVEKLAEGQQELLKAWEFTNMKASHIVGKDWMFLRGRKFKRYQELDAKGQPIYSPSNGKIIVNEQGGFLLEEDQDFGPALPDYTGGLYNSFTYKNVDLSFLIDYQIGGLFFSRSNALMDWKGYSVATVGLNDKGVDVRAPLLEGGGIKPANAVTPDGTPFDKYITAQAYYGTYWWLSEPYVYDASYVKLQEVRLGYSLPRTWMNGIGIQDVNVSVIMSNVLLLYNAAKDSGMDPSEIANDFGEQGQLPATRSMGFNLKVRF